MTKHARRLQIDWKALGGDFWDSDPGNVRLRVEWDTENCESWTGDPCDDCNADNGPMFIAGEYRNLQGDWVHADSIGGMHAPMMSGYGVQEYLLADAYVNDIMRSTIDQYNAYVTGEAAQLARIA